MCLSSQTYEAACTCTLCGNGVVDMGEQCDGVTLPAQSCAGLTPGATGVLSCDPMTCMYDSSMCVGGSAVVTAGTSG